MAAEEPELMIKNASFQPFPKDLFNWKLVTDDFLEASKGKTKLPTKSPAKINCCFVIWQKIHRNSWNQKQCFHTSISRKKFVLSFDRKSGKTRETKAKAVFQHYDFTKKVCFVIWQRIQKNSWNQKQFFNTLISRKKFVLSFDRESLKLMKSKQFCQIYLYHEKLLFCHMTGYPEKLIKFYSFQNWNWVNCCMTTCLDYLKQCLP